MRGDAHGRSCERVHARTDLAGHNERKLKRAKRPRTARRRRNNDLVVAGKQRQQDDGAGWANTAAGHHALNTRWSTTPVPSTVAPPPAPGTPPDTPQSPRRNSPAPP